MAVAVNKDVEEQVGTPVLGLPGASLAGALYMFLGFLAVYHLAPLLYDLAIGWWVSEQLGTFMYQGIRLLVIGAAAVGLFFLWPMVFRMQPGMRAGTAVGVLFLLAGLLVVYIVCRLVETYLLGDAEEIVRLWGGAGVAAATAIAWTVFTVGMFRKPTFQTRLQSLEDQGWFTMRPYKKGQGLRMRRGTMLGILILAGVGLWVYGFRRHFSVSSVWNIDLPFTVDRYVPILYAPGLTITVLLSGLSLWFAYRVVNYPKFADFLIASDAELNKVSWSSQKRLVQDTIVVLATVILMTVFLLLVDMLWSFLLTQLRVIQS